MQKRLERPRFAGGRSSLRSCEIRYSNKANRSLKRRQRELAKTERIFAKVGP